MKKQMIISIFMASGILLSGSIALPEEIKYAEIKKIINNNQVKKMKNLIDTEPSVVNLRGPNNETPLNEAINRGRKAIVNLLLDAGADINAAGQYGKAPLHMAVQRQMEDMVTLLLNKGANVNVTVKGFYDNMTPLHWAAKQGNMDIVKLLVERGADVTLKDSNGKTAAQVAKTDAIKNYLLAKEAAAQK